MVDLAEVSPVGCRLFALMHEAFGKTAAWQFWLALLQASSGSMRGMYDDYDASETPKLSRKEVEDTFRTVWAAAKVSVV